MVMLSYYVAAKELRWWAASAVSMSDLKNDEVAIGLRTYLKPNKRFDS